MNIMNKTNRPLTVPLPQGKKLFLGAGKSGQINAKAAQHPALKKMIDAGELEILNGGKNGPVRTSGSKGAIGGASSSHARGAAINKGGDRSS